MISAPVCVAVIDDEAPVRTMLGRLLRLENYDVVSFESGEAFLAALPLRTPACMILDVHMPGLSGLEVLARLRSMGSEIPAIFITASDDPALDLDVREAGGATLLRKPFSSDQLLEAITAALGRNGQARA